MKTRFALFPCSGNEAEKWSEQDFIFHNVCKVSLYIEVNDQEVSLHFPHYFTVSDFMKAKAGQKDQ
jgi:hypothetical protein